LRRSFEEEEEEEEGRAVELEAGTANPPAVEVGRSD